MKEVWPSSWVHRLIGLGLLLLTVLSAAAFVIDRFFVTSEPVAVTPQDGRFVAVGTESPDVFKSVFSMTEPFLSICPVRTNVWSLGFSWVARVREDSFIENAPPIYVAGPPDMFDLRSERTADFTRSGAVRSTDMDLSTIQVVKSNSVYKVVALRPKYITSRVHGFDEVVYGFRYKTRMITVGRYGLGARGFNLSYYPQLMWQNLWPAGVGKTAVQVQPLSIRSCRSHFMRGYHFQEDAFEPAPSEVGPQKSFEWKLSVEEEHTVTGIVYGGPSYTVKQVAGWFFVSSLAVLLGAFWAAAAGQSGNRANRTEPQERTQKEPMEPTARRTSATNQKRSQNRKRELGRGKRRRRRYR